MTTQSTKVGINLRIISLITFGAGFVVTAVAGLLFWNQVTNRGLPTKISCPSQSDFFPLDQRQNAAANSKLATIDANFGSLHQSWVASGRQDKKIAKKLQAVLRDRQSALLAAAAMNPDTAVQALLTDAERSDAEALTNNCVETLATISGTLTIMHTHLANEQSVNQYIVSSDDGQQTEVFLANAPSTLKTNDMVTVTKGVRIGKSVIADAALPADTTTTADVQIDPGNTINTVAPGDRKVAVIFWYYGADGSPHPTNGAQPAAISDLMFNPAVGSVRNFYEQDSFYVSGTHGVTVSGVVAGNTWYNFRIPEDLPQKTCWGLENLAMRRVVQDDPSFDFSQYDHLVLVGTWRDASNQSCGTGNSTVGPVNTLLPDGTYHPMSQARFLYDYSVTNFSLAHELGHGFGWDHANFLDCHGTSLGPSGCSSGAGQGEYNDYYSVMGRYLTYNNAYLKEYFGWFDSGHPILEVDRTTAAGVGGDATCLAGSCGEWDLAPIGSQGSGIHALKIRTHNSISGVGNYLYLEYRQPIGFDNNGSIPLNPSFGQTYFDGGLFHLPRSRGSWLADASSEVDGLNCFGSTELTSYCTPTLKAGQTLTEPSTGTTIKVVSNTKVSSNLPNSRLRVRVTLGPNYDFAAPIAAFTAPAAGQSVSGTTSTAVTVDDEASGIKQVNIYGIWDGNPHVIFSATESVPGKLHGTYQANWDTTQAPNGPVTLQVTVKDFLNNTQSYTRTVTAVNTDSVPPAITITAPTDGSTVNASGVSEGMTGTASVSDNIGVRKVEWSFDNGPVTRTYFAPTFTGFLFSSYGPHLLRATAYDYVGNTTSATVNFVLHNSLDSIQPTVSIITPSNGASVTGSVPLTASASDASGILQVEWYLDSNTMPLAIVMNSPYSYNWPSDSVSNGTHTLKAKAWDRNGNANTTQITVNTSNSGTSGGGGGLKCGADQGLPPCPQETQ